MKIIVNGEAQETGTPTLAALLEELGKGDAKVATSVNEAFVPKQQRVDHSLQEGDRVEIVAPRQGG
ncbi:sulfur carrier protein ThiS [Lentibacter sp. XHP0401]|uniref:sulfur carrier protein ThiS n=1 Tax=Lentibacter sp. XHP0401 TaxID=2984334 RepID=UPI0021E834ED|nr:sulfur carrier protein ThiS [Lentibacter sp. XHP0401]MCV2894977.1 sulfur carrier protein ThiS [Lentibacter sp. XHP0401]